jgi:hypothetical protein
MLCCLFYWEQATSHLPKIQDIKKRKKERSGLTTPSYLPKIRAALKEDTFRTNGAYLLPLTSRFFFSKIQFCDAAKVGIIPKMI